MADDPKTNYLQWLPLGLACAAAFVAWGTADTRLVNLERDVLQLEANDNAQDARVRSLETNSARQTALVESMANTIVEMKSRQEEIYNLLRSIAPPGGHP